MPEQCSSNSIGLRLWLAMAFLLLFFFPFCLSQSSGKSFYMIPADGFIDDAKCKVEDLEEANDSQLYSILYELVNTTFFQHFEVDLDHKCPLSSWRKDSISSGRGHSEDSEDEFECSGGKDELDVDAEPLCSVDPGAGATNPFGSDPLDANALQSLADSGFESESQQQTFLWKEPSNKVVMETSSELEEGDCEMGLLPETFWMDICSNIKSGETSNVVNLALNPERYTAYNGTHIWKAIYEENCVIPESGDYEVCFEERVLYRMLSGLHSSTTLSIAMNYYPPSKRKGRTNWESNPDFFMDHFKDRPEHIQNLHFSYVVLLRALGKAKPFLQSYEIHTGKTVEDETATILLQRLMDSAILKSCSSVFSAFDESLMFQEASPFRFFKKDVVSLQQNFKGVFHNISSILDCVQCQQCKLHGKMAMLGYGTALKILFIKPESLVLERNEIVALINTIAKMAESVRHVRELTHMYWEKQQEKTVAGTPEPSKGPLATLAREPSAAMNNEPIKKVSLTLTQGDDNSNNVVASLDLVDQTIGLISELGKQGMIPFEEESKLIELALSRHPELLILAKHYSADLQKFWQTSKLLLTTKTVTKNVVIPTTPELTEEPQLDAIVVGSGLAGLAATLSILDRGGRVVLLEKEHLLGGNSNKASSGINGCCLEEDDTVDTLETFRNDTIRSAGSSARLHLINALVNKSADAVAWLKDRIGVDLSLLAQLGGHSASRTHRPSNGMVGAEIIYQIQRAIKRHPNSGFVKILVDTKVTKLLTDPVSGVVGVEYKSLKDGSDTSAPQTLHASHTILATGGFAADRSSGSYLDQHRPELMSMPATAGAFSTGDGITLATSLGAGVVDMDKVQLHPTGWVDPADPDNRSKVLSAELMRGVGGILVNASGHRFVNEVTTRAAVTDKMLSHDATYRQTGTWDVEAPVPTFSLVLSSSAADLGRKHVDLYTHKGFFTKLEGVTALSEWMGLSQKTVLTMLKQYQKDAAAGQDEYGKTVFKGVFATNLENEIFYAGTVTPVLHYCMGGITIDTAGHVLSESGEIIQGLYAAGEVSGGVHGVNRLAGNSLLECTVFGRTVGQGIPLGPSIPGKKIATQTATIGTPGGEATAGRSATAQVLSQQISMQELGKHNAEKDCWVSIHNVVYDLTEFALEHPAGPESIYELCGKDGTDAFDTVHNIGILEDFDEDLRGKLK